MEPIRVEPIEGALNFLGAMARGDLRPKEKINDELDGGITVDTCLAADTDRWETGIKREKIEGKWVIVEQYPDEKAAEVGHKKWVKMMTDDPDLPLKDIDLWSLGLE